MTRNNLSIILISLTKTFKGNYCILWAECKHKLCRVVKKCQNLTFIVSQFSRNHLSFSENLFLLTFFANFNFQNTLISKIMPNFGGLAIMYIYKNNNVAFWPRIHNLKLCIPSLEIYQPILPYVSSGFSLV